MGERQEARSHPRRGLLAFVGPLTAIAVTLASHSQSVPTDALDGVTKLSGSGDMTCAHRADGSTWCWGSDALTREPDKIGYARPIPQSHVIDTALGASNCVLYEDRTVACVSRATRELQPVPGLTEIMQILPTSPMSARRSDGTLLTWSDDKPVTAVTGLPPIRSVSHYGDHSTLAIAENGTAWTVFDWPQQKVVQIPGITDAVGGASGREFHCVLHEDGEVSCFRATETGSPSARLDNVEPLRVPDVDHAIRVAAGEHAACALNDKQHLLCWGDPPPGFHTVPKDWWRVASHREPKLREIVLGSAHLCGLTDSAKVYCWGTREQNGTGASPQSSDREGFVRMSDVERPRARGPVGDLIALTTAFFVLAMLFWARRIDERARWPGGTENVAGDAYRAAGELARADVRPPGLVRAALFLAFLAVGLDVAVNVTWFFLAPKVGWPPLYGVLPLVWSVVAAQTSASAARGDLRAVARLLRVGAMGAFLHVALTLLHWREMPDHGSLLLWLEFALVLAFGVAASIVLLMAYGKGRLLKAPMS